MTVLRFSIAKLLFGLPAPTDDRQQPVEWQGLTDLLSGERASGNQDHELLEIVARSASAKQSELGLFEPIMMRRMALSFLATVGMMVLLFLCSTWLGVGTDTVAFGIVMILIVFSLLLQYRFARTRETLQRIESFTYYGRCPACAYRLRELAPESDGCVRCTECAAAWRRDRVAPAAVLAEFDQTVHARADAKRPWSDSDRSFEIRPNRWRWVPRQHIRDANGRSVPLLTRDLRGVPPERASAFTQSRDELQAVALAGGRWWVVIPVLGIAFAAFMFNGALSKITFAGGVIDGLIKSLGLFMPVFLCGLSLLTIVRWLSPKWVIARAYFRDAVVRIGRCPSCAGALSTPPEGRRICGECGCAWNQPK